MNNNSTITNRCTSNNKDKKCNFNKNKEKDEKKLEKYQFRVFQSDYIIMAF